MSISESFKEPVNAYCPQTPVIFEKGKRNDPCNHRPVSLTSVADNIIEIILGGTEKHLKDSEVIGHS